MCFGWNLNHTCFVIRSLIPFCRCHSLIRWRITRSSLSLFPLFSSYSQYSAYTGGYSPPACKYFISVFIVYSLFIVFLLLLLEKIEYGAPPFSFFFPFPPVQGSTRHRLCTQKAMMRWERKEGRVGRESMGYEESGREREREGRGFRPLSGSPLWPMMRLVWLCVFHFLTRSERNFPSINAIRNVNHAGFNVQERDERRKESRTQLCFTFAIFSLDHWL